MILLVIVFIAVNKSCHSEQMLFKISLTMNHGFNLKVEKKGHKAEDLTAFQVQWTD